MTTPMPEQSAANHARMVPGFHYVTGLLAFGNLIWSAVHLARVPSAGHAQMVLIAVILLLLGWYARTFPLTVQNRVIRLEERLRMREVLPSDMHPKISSFTPEQLIAMRFASDAELADLARRVLAEDIHDTKAIKASIKQWRADHLRA